MIDWGHTLCVSPELKLTLLSLIDILWSAEAKDSSGNEMPEVPSGKP
jgi:hypothetical protein